MKTVHLLTVCVVCGCAPDGDPGAAIIADPKVVVVDGTLASGAPLPGMNVVVRTRHVVGDLAVASLDVDESFRVRVIGEAVHGVDAQRERLGDYYPEPPENCTRTLDLSDPEARRVRLTFHLVTTGVERIMYGKTDGDPFVLVYIDRAVTVRSREVCELADGPDSLIEQDLRFVPGLNIVITRWLSEERTLVTTVSTLGPTIWKHD